MADYNLLIIPEAFVGQELPLVLPGQNPELARVEKVSIGGGSSAFSVWSEPIATAATTRLDAAAGVGNSCSIGVDGLRLVGYVGIANILSAGAKTCLIDVSPLVPVGKVFTSRGDGLGMFTKWTGATLNANTPLRAAPIFSALNLIEIQFFDQVQNGYSSGQYTIFFDVLAQLEGAP